ncbi:peptidoglycan editing factor PgeF [Legionella tunisiensis]|uniref:peptidoglycan editing factor PgeF n=1 Tax=Legionella tunisiensis TaxID=1034944 RepID=UPI00031C0104|nr:peptidoglycan editing factor PgeF [Legionella tunisiensis]
MSEGRYSSLNCAYGSDDEPRRIEENRRRITSFFGYPLTSLITVKNIHGDKAVIVDQHWSENETVEADAMVTKQKNILLGSDSADCPIVLFADEHAGVIGLAHAGWRGAKAGVLESTIHKMQELGAAPNNVVAAISPCIAQTSYEVSHDFYQGFISDNPYNARYFKKAKKLNHFMFDLPGFVDGCLINLRLKSIGHIGIDTYTDKRFFSCRRAYHAGEDDFGGNFSCILLR